MNQGQLAELFATSVPNISMHISNILKENELQGVSVIKNYLTTAIKIIVRRTDSSLQDIGNSNYEEKSPENKKCISYKLL